MHKPVLKKEVLQCLDVKPNENFIDGTLGQAGHTIEILKKSGPEGKVLGIDLDANQIENSKLLTADFKERIIFVNDSYTNVKEIVEKINFKPVNGILLDLGYSSWHIENSNRGFSFARNEILDMRYDFHPVKSRLPQLNSAKGGPASLDLTGRTGISQNAKLFNGVKNTLTAEKIVNEYPESKIEKILRDFGEEKFAKQIAKKITEQRKIKKIESTFELIDIIGSAIPAFAQRKGRGLSVWAKAQAGAKSFQALRIAVNGELDNLVKFLPEAVDVLDKGGRLVVISFHSLEDRIVKNFFKNKEKEKLIKILNKKPIIAKRNEVMLNPRSRSAKLRAIVKS